MDEGMFEPEEWMLGLKRAYEAGYYKTEPATDEQERFPWQDKSCRDCPFWLDTEWCEVFAREQHPTVHTCSYFDDLTLEGTTPSPSMNARQRAASSKRGAGSHDAVTGSGFLGSTDRAAGG